MTDYLCIGFPPIQSVCKLTLTFPDTFVTQKYSVTSFSGTAHLRRLHFSLLISEKWAVFLMTSIQRFQQGMYHAGAVLWKQYGEIQRDPAAKCQEQNPSSACFGAQCYSAWTWCLRSYVKPDDIPEFLPTDPYRFWVDARSPCSSVCDITACFHTSEWWGHRFRPPGLKALRSKLISVGGNRAEKYLALLREKGEEWMSWARAHMCLNRKSLIFHRRGEECFARCKTQPRLDKLLQLSLQNKSPALLRKPCAHTEETGKQATSPKACLCSRVSSLVMVFLGLCSWDLQCWEVRNLFLTPSKKRLRGAPSMGSAGSFCWWSKEITD